MGSILKIFTAPEAGVPMISLTEVEAIVGVGLAGDRYALGNGAFSKIEKIHHVTLIAKEDIDAANQELEKPFGYDETRRNLVTEFFSVDVPVGGLIRVANRIILRVIEPADPCKRPAALARKKKFDIAFRGRGGLRCEIVEILGGGSSGLIRLQSNICRV